MSSPVRTSACLLLAVAYTLSAASPCQPVLSDRDGGPPFAASVERRAAWDAARAAEPEASIAPTCPCGCEKKSPSRTGGSAGFALSRSTTEHVFPPAGFDLALAPPVAAAAPDLGIDPVPI